MKCVRMGLVLVAAFALAATTSMGSVELDSAPMYGLPVADTAAPAEQGAIQATAGMGFSSDIWTFGARCSYGVINGLSAFVDAAYLSLDEDVFGSASGFGLQGGAMYALPFELPIPIDIAIRAALFKPFIEDVSIIGGLASGVVSYGLGDYVDGLTAYGALGIDFYRWEVDTGVGKFDDTDAGVNVSVGAVYELNDMFSFYAELGFANDPVIGGGARAGF